MTDISVSIVMLLIRGIPECLLAVLALHVFTRTKINPKKYFLLSFIYVVATYVIRLLPIALGVNTVLSFFVMFITFQFAYKTQLSRVIRSIASTAVVLIVVAISELFSMLLLILLFGQQKAEELCSSSDRLVQSLSASPSNVFFAIFIYVGYLILKQWDKRKKASGEASGEVSEKTSA